MAMEGKVKTPFGEMNKKTAVFGGLGVAGAGVFLYIRHKNSIAAATTTPSTTDTSGSTSDQTGIDPATGFPYGSAEDEAALAQQQGIGYTPYGGGGYPGGGYTGGPPTPGPGTFTTNADWAQYVEQWLVGNEGADPTTVGNAIGKYITGQPLTPDMVTVVENAIAIGGNPPVPGPNGDPPAYKTTPPPPPPPPNQKVKVPNVVGQEVDAAQRVLDAAGLKYTRDRLKTGHGYHVTATNPGAGTKVNSGSTVHLTIAENK